MANELSKQTKLDLRYLRMARIWAENSYCKRRQVGALVVKDKMIISDGYNGTPSGFENVCEDNNVTKPYVLHAEANAITKLARSSNNSEGSTLYVTASPCIECAKLIIQSGIKRVVYAEKYRLDDGIKLMQRAGIKVDGAVLAGAGTIHGVMAIMQDGTIPGLIPGSTLGIMAMQAGMDGVAIILGIGEVWLWLTCAQATAIVALAIQHQALT